MDDNPSRGIVTSGRKVIETPKHYPNKAPTSANQIFRMAEVEIAKKVILDITTNYDSEDRPRRLEAKEMLTKMKDKIFQSKSVEVQSEDLNGSIDESLGQDLLEFIQTRRAQIEQGANNEPDEFTGISFHT